MKSPSTFTGSLLMIGCGNMGRALLKGWQAAGALGRFASVTVCKPSLPHEDQKLSSVRYVTSLNEAGHTPTIILIATKPDKLEDVLTDCKRTFGDAPIIYVSIVAGKPIGVMSRLLGADAKIIRAMPNTPVEYGAGVTGMAFSPAVTEDDRRVLMELFASLGLALTIDESNMDALTSLSGSGPAYVFYFMECLAIAAARIGLSDEEADMLVRHTMLGAGTLAVNSACTPLSTLREQVTSKGGVTQAALNVWMQPGTLEHQAEEALKAALARGQELAKLS